MNKQWLKKWYYWLLPASCVLCREITSGAALCAPCHADLPWQQIACVRCAYPLSLAGTCGECLQHPPAYDNTVALFRYQTPIDHLIVALKFHKKLDYAQLLGELMAVKMVDYYQNQPLPEVILPVPLHPQRLRERGYNQALEIARPLAKKLRVRLDTQSSRRVLFTSPQLSIPAAARKHNMKNAFMIEAPFTAEHVAIVDDVMTTGSTVNEFARVLQEAGVRRIDVWCCARTVLRS